ncbi:MAG: TIGR01777 family protein [Deltaproteobacteria bacterium RIFCSPLOWO2_02_FULL_50_16]|nr:MAG: TIGR01777 family protein [Deltaproteobacteria bacterium RIFCSPHIGHO2_02_FULL_50_15]OGQ56450.1 MAG: TIGR01777 family protein [Deltaproteobacteria bacterium RIFCSPLOWO2_02_FULL_50_16]OGQ66853.1 MAG: TIGR01777 family protein [Deltaproteobacteria bacterium RIFCSPLOWO2_12_FULL_50_11]
MKIILSGGSGFIGKALVEHFKKGGHQIVLLTRNPSSLHPLAGNGIHIEVWDGRQRGPWAQHVNGADIIINLAGERLVSQRWTEKQKYKILRSRIEATQALVEAVEHSSTKPTLFINASAIGYYGPLSKETATEDFPKGEGYVADVCELWEQEAHPVERWGVRLVLLRLGGVLGKSDGWLKKMLPSFQYFLGGALGSGRQWLSWIHLEDVVKSVQFIIEHHDLDGPINLTTPYPVTMNECAKTLGRILHRPSCFKVPGFILKLALGEMSEIILTGQKVLPQKLLNHGYSFSYPQLEPALIHILKDPPLK